MWPDEQVSRIVTENFIPARVHPRQDGEKFQQLGERFGALWTPTILFLDSEGTERHRIEGFLPVPDFLPRLYLGLGHLAFRAENWDEAQKRFQTVLDQFPQNAAAPEAQYWEGVSRYKKTGSAEVLEQIAAAFEKRYQDSEWAKRASVWEPSRRR